MSSIDKAVQVIRAHDADGACNEPECLAQDLADAGLLMPDLPAPYKPRAWHAGIADVRCINPRMEDGEMLEVIVLHSNGRIFCSKEQARQLAYALLAAANHAEGENRWKDTK